jgi:ATP-dependent helicase/nuclease subunit A
LLVDWPVEAAHPLRCAFVYNESRCPPSLADLLGAEMRAREREEINGLYVAMTRARRQLVFSATEPFLAPTRPSWWQRVQAIAPAAEPEPPTTGSPPERVSGPASLRVLPRRTPAAPAALPAAAAWRPAAAVAPPGAQLSLPFTETVAARDPSAVRSIARDEPRDDAARALGLAIHRLLVWLGRPGSKASIADLAAAASAEFGARADEVERRATAILHHPHGARWFVGPQIVWSGNEVSVGDGGDVIRIDRLVKLQDEAGAAWWVLDYKLHHAPEQLEAYRAQLLRYRAVVARAQPGENVRCAFVTGEGRVVEVS